MKRSYQYLIIPFLLYFISCSKKYERSPAVYLISDTKKYNLNPVQIKKDIAAYKSDMQDVIKTILHDCPPEDCYIISPGRSLAILIEYIDSMTENYILNFPLSSFAYNIGSGEVYNKIYHSEFIESTHPAHFPDLSKKIKEKLFQHFDNFIDMDKVGDRKVLLLDFANSGNSLFTLNIHLEEYFKSKNITKRIDLFGLSLTSTESLIRRNAEYFKKDIDLLIYRPNLKAGDASWVANTLRKHEQKPYSRFGVFNIRTDETYKIREEVWNPLPYMDELGMLGKASLGNAKLKKTTHVKVGQILRSCHSLLSSLASKPGYELHKYIRSKGW